MTTGRTAPPAYDVDPVAAAALRGLPLDDLFVVDGHAHFCQERTVNAFFPQAEVSALVASMDRFGVDVACVSGIATMQQNDEVAAAVAARPDRLVGFALFNPRYDDGPQELERLLAGPHFRGIGEVHPTSYHHSYPITGERYRPMFELAERYGAPVLIHSGPESERDVCSPAMIGEMAGAHPDAVIILGHCGAYGANPWPLLDEAIGVARRHANVWLDLCGTGRHLGIVEHVVAAVGDERVLFGSDATFHGWAAEIAHVALADLPENSKRRILGANMAAVLGLDQEGRRAGLR